MLLEVAGVGLNARPFRLYVVFSSAMASVRKLVLHVTLDGTKHALEACVSVPDHRGPWTTCAILGHGGGDFNCRGGHLDMGNLRAVADSLAGAGVPCLRYTYGPVVDAPGGRFHADRVARQAMLKHVLTKRARRIPEFAHAERWLLCGLSVFATACLRVALETPDVAGCILMGMPIHDPGTGILFRTGLARLRVRSLLVVGTEDGTSTPAAFDEMLRGLRDARRLVHVCVIQGGMHRIPHVLYPDSHALDYRATAKADAKVCRAVRAFAGAIDPRPLI